MAYPIFLSIPGVLDRRQIAELESSIEGIGAKVLKVCHVDGIGTYADNSKVGPFIYSADGIHQVFYGNPTGGFDIESRVRGVFPDSIVSNGKVFPTGEETWIVRADPKVAGIPDRTRDMGRDIMAAMVALGMHQMGANGSGYSAKSREEVPGLKDLLAEAGEYGIRDGGTFLHWGGVPFVAQRYIPMATRVSLIRGTEVLISGEVKPELKMLQSPYRINIHPAIPIKDVA